MSLKEAIANAIEKESPDMAAVFRHTADVKSLKDANKYFRSKLIAAPVSTLDERGSLISDVDQGTWLEYFSSHVLPTLVRFSLIN